MLLELVMDILSEQLNSFHISNIKVLIKQKKIKKKVELVEKKQEVKVNFDWLHNHDYLKHYQEQIAIK